MWTTRKGFDPYGNTEHYVLTPWGGLLLNHEDVCDPETHWFFVGVFDQHDPVFTEDGEQVAVYAKGLEQINLMPTTSERRMTEQLLEQRHYLHDDVVQRRLEMFSYVR